jgi:energy-coupling factor transporter ATP-binding protein EcfA2
VEREIAFGLQNLKQDDTTMKKRINDALEFSGLTLRRASHPMSLSGGEQQRLALAGVLAMEPDILLLDEVTSLLSPASRRHILEAIAATRRSRNLTVLMTTQYPQEALASGRLIVLHGGRIALDGNPAELFSHRNELRRFGVGLPDERS